ncbi:MAG: rhodanese-like domain-containing protein [Bacteroidales bacterium]|nr:rhodanese-like domain-containing protein [Bacteroidales bacterium]
MKRIIPTFFLLLLIACTGFAQTKGFTSMSNEPFAKLIKKKSVQLIDVRDARQYEKGHIKGAINIEFSSKGFDRKLMELKKRKPVAVYCNAGRSSKSAAKKLVEMGFKKVYELDKGFKSWDGEKEP